jgi:hypothetical protein
MNRNFRNVPIQRLLRNINGMKILLTVVSLLTLAVALWAGLKGETRVLIVGFLAFATLLFIANLDRISEFKATGTGIEARTREVLQRAEVTLNELQALGKQVGTVTLSLVKRTGRFGGYSDKEKDEIKDSVLRVLKQLGINESELTEVLSEWHRFTEFDYAHFILGGPTIPEGAPPEVLKEWKELRHGGINKIPTPGEIRAFLERHGFMTSELQEWLKDYEYYLESRTHRRPEVWEQRRSLGRLKKT